MIGSILMNYQNAFLLLMIILIRQKKTECIYQKKSL